MATTKTKLIGKVECGATGTLKVLEDRHWSLEDGYTVRLKFESEYLVGSKSTISTNQVSEKELRKLAELLLEVADDLKRRALSVTKK